MILTIQVIVNQIKISSHMEELKSLNHVKNIATMKMKNENNGVDHQYQNIIREVLNEGYYYDDPNRKGVQRLEIPSYTFRHDFKHGFPAITLKKLAFKSVTTELIWFLRGDTNIKYLVDNGCNIWNKDAYNYYLKQCEILKLTPLSMSAFITDVKEGKKLRNTEYTFGDLDKVYGHYWRNWEKFEKHPTVNDLFNIVKVDQIQDLIHDMINKPMSSELLVVARNPADKEVQALPCCHYGFQIVMRPLSYIEHCKMITKKKVANYEALSDLGHTNDDIYEFYDLPQYGFELHWKQRSCDLFLGIPFNIASYAELALILEKITGHKALAIQGDLKKVHLYDNSITEAKELLKRKPSNTEVKVLYKDEFHYITDKSISGDVSLDTIFNEMKPDWFKLEGYNPQPPMRVEMLSRS